MKIFSQLLPNARAWSLVAQKNLKTFFESLETSVGAFRTFFDLVWLDIFPATTRQIAAWEEQFGLLETGISDLERRERLAGAWVALGGQTPSYIQETLQTAGFPVFVHEWWLSKSPLIMVDPSYYLRKDLSVVAWNAECGEPNAECGQSWMQCGDFYTIPGYAIQNGVPIALPSFPDTLWPYFLYIGGQVFGTQATIPADRQTEFQTLCEKIAPTHVWLGLLVTYS